MVATKRLNVQIVITSYRFIMKLKYITRGLNALVFLVNLRSAKETKQ